MRKNSMITSDLKRYHLIGTLNWKGKTSSKPISYPLVILKSFILRVIFHEKRLGSLYRVGHPCRNGLAASLIDWPIETKKKKKKNVKEAHWVKNVASGVSSMLLCWTDWKFNRTVILDWFFAHLREQAAWLPYIGTLPSIQTSIIWTIYHIHDS